MEAPRRVVNPQKPAMATTSAPAARVSVRGFFMPDMDGDRGRKVAYVDIADPDRG